MVILAIMTLAIGPTVSAATTITNTTELLPLIGVNGSVGLPFRIDAQVIRPSSAENKYFYIKADDGCVALVDKVFWPALTLKSGDVITASGITTLNNKQHYYVTANSTNIVIRGWRPPPAPKHTIVESILHGHHQFELVEFTGTIRDVYLDEIDKEWLVVVLASGYNAVGLSVCIHNDEYRKATGLIGAEVLVTGIPLPFTTGTRIVFGTNVELHSIDDIRITKEPPTDPFSAPDLKLTRHPQAPAISSLGRRRAEGTVVAVWQGDCFLLKSSDGALMSVRLAEKHAPSYGEYVEVVGLPDTDLYRINLKRAHWRRKEGIPASSETPTPIAAQSLLRDSKGLAEANPNFHGKVVRLIGTILSIPSSANNNGIIYLKCDGCTLPLDTSATPMAREGLTEGVKIEATGVCVVKTESWHPSEPTPRIEGMSIVVRSPADIKVIAHPSWWTPGRLVVLVAVLVAVIILILLWNRVLHRVSERRGLALADERMRRMESALKVEERTRIAVELHDSIAQNLTGVSLELDSAEHLAEKDHAGMLAHLRIAAQTLQSCRNELRNCLWDLRSRALEEQDLNEAIRRAIAPQVSDIDLSIRFNIPRKRLSDDMAHVLMRIIRELVINAVRHGRATAVKIAGSDDGDRLLFSVRDNGSGFDPDNCPGVLQGHFGLQGIQERINQFNGEMKIDSVPDKGTHVTIALDMPATSPAATNAL